MRQKISMNYRWGKNSAMRGSLHLLYAAFE
jgi:hypothetical protein